MRVAVLCSGSGTNLQALLDREARGALAPAEIVLVLANEPGAKALERARSAGKPTRLLDHRASPDRAAYDAALAAALGEARVELVVLAGFLRILGPAVLAAFPARILNIHPSLLPAFPGLHAQRQALAAGVRVAGCTVHFVDGGTDTGPILAQAAVPVLEGDTEAALTARILAEEHRLLPAAVQRVAQGRVTLAGRVVRIDGDAADPGASLRSLPEPR